MIKLILIRHGETEWVRQHRYQGSTDVPLNSRGLRQARALARLLKKERALAVYSSKLTRAWETAKLIANTCGRGVRADSRLNEVSFGIWEGEIHAEIRTKSPKASRDWYRARWSSQPPGGESLRSLKKRISDFLKELIEKFGKRNGSCIIVTHGGPSRMFLIHLLKIDPKVFWSVRVDPASITIIELNRDQEELVLLNSQEHLNGFKRD